MKTKRIAMSICPLCDAHYDDSDAEQVKIHDHPEPQSGPLITVRKPEEEQDMSWGIQLIGKPDKVNERLQKYSESLRAESKAEFDEALPHLVGLISQVVGAEVMVKLNASGHATYQNGAKLQGHLSVSIEILYAELAL